MLKTEERNKNSKNLDKMSTLEILQLLNNENYNAVKSVEMALHEVEMAIEAVVTAFEKKGRLFYMGAGTSGRLGVLDAAECPPTFGVPKDKVIGLIAGGEKALVSAVEGFEDSKTAGIDDLKSYKLNKNDVVMGISAAGGANYVLYGLTYAKEIGCKTIALSSNFGTPIGNIADISIVTDTGAEVLTGSTRLKAGTAQKLVLNMITTCAMIKSGFVYENLMINLKPSNVKLRDRMIRIVREIKEVSYEDAEAMLEKSDWNIKETVEK